MSDNKYSENLLEAMRIMADATTQVAYDRTVTCAILSQDKKDKTKYYVSDGSSKFFAYAENNKSYSKDSQVYVLVPKGDYTNKKIIIGQYSSDKKDSSYQEAQQNLQIKPFKNFVSSYKIENTSWSSDDQNTFLYQPAQPYDYLGLELQINTYDRTNTPYNITKDGYKFIVTVEYEQGETKSFALSSAQLSGNPFNQVEQIKIQYLFAWPKEINHYTIKEISFVSEAIGEFDIDDDLSIKNYTILFGYDASNLSTGLFIQPKYGTPTEYGKDTNGNNIPATASLIVYEVADEIDGNKVIYTNDNKHSNFVHYWCRYDYGYQKGNPNDIDTSGTYYKTLKTEENSYEFIIRDGSDNYFMDNYITSDFKLVQYIGDDYLVSNAVQFINQTRQSEAGGVSTGAGDSLILQLGENDDGRYNIYGNDNKLITSLAGEKTIKAKFVQDALNNSGSNLILTSVVWKIPKTGTQLAPIRKSDNSLDGWEDDGQYYTYTFEIGDNNKSNALQNQELRYTFNQIYNPGNTNNRITCEVEGQISDAKENFIGSMDVYFGMAGTSGTDFNFYITADSQQDTELLEGQEPVFMGSKSITFSAHLETLDGQTLTNDLSTVQWDFGQGFQTGTGSSFTCSRQDPVNNKWSPYSAYVTATYEMQTSIREHKIQLKAYYLPITGTRNIKVLSGPFNVIYDTFGLNPTYDLEPYQFDKTVISGYVLDYVAISFDNENSERIVLKDTRPDEIRVDKEGSLLNKIGSANDYEFKTEFAPFISSNYNRAFLLAQAHQSSNPSSNIITWSRPIYIARNSYASSLLNSWDELNKIDTNGKYILSQMMGAGTKNNSNQFTGVLMGQIGEAGEAFKNAKHGLYGFKEGAEVFSLKDNGSFFVGDTQKDIFISFNENNTRSELGELNIKTKRFYLGNPNSNIQGDINGNISITASQFSLSGNGMSSSNGTTQVGDTESYIKFDTTESNLQIKAKQFTLGNNTSNISGDSDGNLDIKSEYFDLQGGLVHIYNTSNASGFHLKDPSSSEGNQFTYYIENGVATFQLRTNTFELRGGNCFFMNANGGEIRLAPSTWDGNSWDSTDTLFYFKGDSSQLYIKTQHFVLNTSGNKLTIGTGTNYLKYENGTLKISGELSAATGTFAGSLAVGNNKIYVGKVYSWQSHNGLLIKDLGVNTTYPLFGFFYKDSYSYGFQKQDHSWYNKTWTNISFLSGKNILGLGVDSFGNINPIIILTHDSLGSEIHLLGTLYSQTGTIISSDKRLKKDIVLLEQQTAYNKFYDTLKPVTFKYLNGTSNRNHIGFCAQEVYDSIIDNNMTTQDFAGFVQHQDEIGTMGLRYEEFIALNTWQIQMLKSRVAELEKEIKEIKQNEI